MAKLTNILNKINRDLGEEIATVGMKRFDTSNKIPFSSPRMNWMTYGGIPLGRLIEISGSTSSGKTTTTLDLVANAQKLYPDKEVVYVDTENTLDLEWAQLLGVDTDKLILISPKEQSAEWIFQQIVEIIQTGEVSVVVLDSIGVMVSQQALGKTIEEDTMGGISKALTKFVNVAVGLCKKNNVLFIGINQVRDNVSPYGGGVLTPGGNAWKHNTSVRLQMKQSSYIDENGKILGNNAENPQGNLVQANLKKTKVFKNDRRLSFYTLNYTKGIDAVNDAIEMAEQLRIITRSGAFYSIENIGGGEKKIQGKENLKEFLKTEPDLLDNLLNKVYDVLNGKTMIEKREENN